MTLADDVGAEEAILGQARQEVGCEPSKMIDCIRGTQRPAIRHIVRHVNPRGWVLTACGAKVISYSNADSSMFYTNGTKYARYCKRCFPNTA